MVDERMLAEKEKEKEVKKKKACHHEDETKSIKSTLPPVKQKKVRTTSINVAATKRKKTNVQELKN